MLAGAELIGKRLNQLFEPGFGVLKYRLAVAEKEDVEIEIQELAHAALKPGRVIDDALRQESALPRRVADDGIADDQMPRIPPQQGTSPGNFAEASTTSNGPTVPPTSNVSSNSVSWLRAWSASSA